MALPLDPGLDGGDLMSYAVFWNSTPAGANKAAGALTAGDGGQLGRGDGSQGGDGIRIT